MAEDAPAAAAAPAVITGDDDGRAGALEPAALAAPEESATTATATAAPLPDGCAVLVGEDGQQYVTLEQDGQTYAIPADEYHAAQRSAGVEIHDAPVIQSVPVSVAEASTPTVVVQQAPPPPPEAAVAAAAAAPVLMLQPVAPPPGILRARQLQEERERMQKQQQEQNKAPKVPKVLKSINVENWGIFLLNRFQEYFHKKELSDLTIRYSARNTQIKAHSLVVHACTDFFLERLAEEGGEVAGGGAGVVDMPEEFAPDAVAPVIKFMYTGKLDLPSQAAYAKCRATADKFGMSVLTKLLDDQLKEPPTPVTPAKKSKKAKKTDDPIKQMKKIQRIEKKFTQEEKRARQQQFKDGLSAAQRSRVKLEEEFAGEDTVPGKKLPIWKKRTSLPPGATVASPTTGSANPTVQPNSKLVLTPVSGLPPGAKLMPVNLDPSSIIVSPAPNKPPKSQTSPEVPPPPPAAGSVVASRAYSRGFERSSSDAPRVPRKIREIQENLNFEKIRRTGIKNTKSSSSSDEWKEVTKGITKEMSVEELREFMEEQRKRLRQIGDGDDALDDDDDYYDNDAGMQDDDYPEEEDVSQGDDSAATGGNDSNAASSVVSPSRPILKTEQPSPSSAPRKSVRFSLRPGAIPTPQNIDATSSPPTTEVAPAEEKEVNNTPLSPPKKRGRPPATTAAATEETLDEALDNTVDAFNQAMEEEEQQQQQQTETPTKKGRGRPKKTPPKQAEPAKDPLESPRRSDRNVAKSETAASAPPPAKRRKVSTTSQNGSGGAPNHSKLVMEVLRKNPDLFKHNKQVKLKVMAKDSSGKAVMKYITLKAQDAVQPSPTVPTESTAGQVSITSIKLRDVPKVRYSGGRGRPHKLRPGEPDPHAEERLRIERRFAETEQGSPNVMVVADNEITTLDQVGKTEVMSTLAVPAGQQPLDPSSEAEALSNVASSIAASLGVDAQQQQQQQTVTTLTELVPVTAVTTTTAAAQVVYDVGSVIVANGQAMQVLQTTADGSVVVAPANVEAAMAQLHEGGAQVPTQQMQDKSEKKAVSQLAEDWDEEDGEEV